MGHTPMSRPVAPRPFPIQPLLDRAKPPSLKALGLPTARAIQKCRHDQGGMLNVAQADRLAMRLGLHPGAIWDNWWDDETAECAT